MPQTLARSLRVLAVTALACLGVVTTAIAADVQVRGLTAQTAAGADGTRARTYLTGTCQPKKTTMQCHLHAITVTPLDTSLLAAQSAAILAQAQQEPHHLDTVLARHLPALCPDPVPGAAMAEAPPVHPPLSSEAQALQQATAQFCAARSVEHLRMLLELRLQRQARTCTVWVQSTTKTFTLRGKEWISRQGPSGPCGVMETAVLSHPLTNRDEHITHFQRYSVRQTVTRPQAPYCPAEEAKDYGFVVEPPWYADCAYLDFSPLSFGWSVWPPRAP